MVEFYCQSLSLYFPYILVLPQLPYLQMILCCQRQQEEQVMKLNDDMLEPTPFQSPFHLHSSGNLKRFHGHKSGHTNTNTLLSSLASRSSLVLPSSVPSISFYPSLTLETLGYWNGKDSWGSIWSLGPQTVTFALSEMGSRCDVGVGVGSHGVMQVTSPPLVMGAVEME